MILYDSEEAAQFMTGISGWVDKDGRFWGNDEHMARWSGCTHLKCEVCGRLHEKGWTKCDICREKSRSERYCQREAKDWDGLTALYSDSHDEFFFDLDSIRDYLEENDGSDIDSLDLIICKPIRFPQIDEDYFLDDMHEDTEIPADMQEAIDNLNKVIRDTKPQCWEPGKYRAIIK